MTLHFIQSQMDVLKNFNSKKLYEILALKDDEFERWLMDLGLLFRSRDCKECGNKMFYKHVKGRKRPNWRCTKKTCRKECGFLNGTWFEGSHLTLKEVFQISYYWCRQTHSQNEIKFDMKREDGTTPGSHAIVDWKNFYRDVCAFYFIRNPAIIGGAGHIVEIDETVITKRKYERGVLRAEQLWFFGGVERGTGNCFLVPIEHRNAATLLPLIQKHILPGTTIISDKWAAYNNIDKLPQLYQHFSVNHSDKEHPFVDQTTGACTNMIEGTWQEFKARHKEEYGTSRTLFVSYIEQFLWRKRFSGDNVMYYLWNQINEMYSLV